MHVLLMLHNLLIANIRIKRFVLEWLYEDQNDMKNSMQPTKHVCAQGHSTSKHKIHSWISKCDKNFLNSDNKLVDY